MFNFLKKSKEAPPDIGQEQKFDEEHIEEASEPDEPVAPKIESSSPVVVTNAVSSGMNDLSRIEIEKLNARIEAITEWIKQFYERFAYLSESIGSIRTANMNNEKEISKISVEAQKAVDIVQEVKPENLRLEYQKIDAKIQALSERLMASRQFSENLMKEFKDIKRQSDVFIGTEGIVKLNEEVKKDLIEAQKLNEKTRMHADKVEEIFLNVKKNFTDYQKLLEIVSDMNENYSGLKKQVERLDVTYKGFVKESAFSDFNKSILNKLAVTDDAVERVKRMEGQMKDTIDLVEKCLSISKRNSEDIGNLAINLGNDNVKRVSDYENQIFSILDVLSDFAEQISAIKNKLGLKGEIKKPLPININNNEKSEDAGEVQLNEESNNEIDEDKNKPADDKTAPEEIGNPLDENVPNEDSTIEPLPEIEDNKIPEIEEIKPLSEEAEEIKIEKEKQIEKMPKIDFDEVGTETSRKTREKKLTNSSSSNIQMLEAKKRFENIQSRISELKEKVLQKENFNDEDSLIQNKTSKKISQNDKIKKTIAELDKKYSGLEKKGKFKPIKAKSKKKLK